MGRNLLTSFLLAGLLLHSCTERKTESGSETEHGRYILSLSLPSRGSYPFQVVEDLESGVADIADAKPVPEVPNSVLVAGKDGVVFLNSKQKLTKYLVTDGNVLKEQGSVPNTGLLGGPISAFLDDDNLLVSTAPRQVQDSLFAYQIINTSDMKEVKTGKIKLPVKKGSVASPSMYIAREGKIFVPYIHADQQNHAYGRANVAIFNAGDMSYEKTISTDKTACLGYSVVSSHAVTEEGDLYLISSNSNYWGGNESLPSGIVRIRKGQMDFDASYFFNISAQLNDNHSGGMIYAGGNKVIVQVFESSLVKAYKDYQQGYVISYYEADLGKRSLKKLNVPLSKYPRRALERLKDGKVAIANNAEDGENAFYLYDPKTGSVKKGLVYNGAEYLSGLVAF